MSNRRNYNQFEFVPKSGAEGDSGQGKDAQAENTQQQNNNANNGNQNPSNRGGRYKKNTGNREGQFQQEENQSYNPQRRNNNQRNQNRPDSQQNPQTDSNLGNPQQNKGQGGNRNQRYNNNYRGGYEDQAGYVEENRGQGGYKNQRYNNYKGGYDQQQYGEEQTEEFRGYNRGGRGGSRGGRGGQRGGQGQGQRGGQRGGRGGRGGQGQRGGRGGYQGGQNNERPQEGYEEEKVARDDKEEEEKINVEGEEGEGSEGSGGDPEDIEDMSQVPMSELAEILQERFKRNQIHCPICLNKIKKDARMWSCKQCFGPFHLSCLQKWVFKNPANLKDGKVIPGLKFFNWACPKCNYNYTESMPDYKCFCRKETNPEFDPYNIPHSCSNTCGKFRGPSCVHPCPLGCHPGPCPPCRAMGKEQNCYCGSKKMKTRCGDESAGFSCNEICNKLKNCGKHHCEEVCHAGPCPRCEEIKEVACHCGKQNEVRECGNEDFSCQKVCGKTLNCGNHTCKAICHSGPCAECPYTPDKMSKCCCGRMSAMVLGADNRKSCLDPIPICGLPCEKIMVCGHKCRKMCHPYECGPCKEVVVQTCRCGKDERKIECWKTTSEDQEERVFMCDRVCKKLKSCRAHKCQRVCCEASKGNDPEGHHLCIKVCGKTLNCGNHTCSDFCHLGNCKQCPILINQPMSCTCGKTVKHPPLPCGTRRPDCYEPCSRTLPCGHTCYMKCHYDPCPPCEELLEKVCKCGKKTLKMVRCSRDANCGIACDTILPCKHKCGVVCHEGPCNMERGKTGCGAKCKKIKGCGHPCEAACHPTAPCPDNKCKVQIKITCDCGHRESLILCGDKNQAKLECDKTCANMKRFGGFVSKVDAKKPYYPPMLVRFAKNNWNFLLKVESKLETMVKEGQEMTDISISDNTTQRKQALYQLLSRTYCLELQFFLHVKNPSIVVRWTKDSKLPTMKLTEYLKEIESGRIRPDILPFEATIKFYNLSIIDTTDELERILKEFQDEYYLERTENKQIMAHFWKKDVAEIALRAIKKSVTNFSSAALEENLDLKAEEEKMAAAAEVDLKIAKEQGNDEESKESDSIFAAFNK